MAQKFIVTSDGTFRFGEVVLHRHLLKNAGEFCIGGGFYEFDYSTSTMLLYGKSYDFGRPKWSYIDVLHMPAALEGLNITYEDLPLTDFVNVKFDV